MTNQSELSDKWPRLLKRELPITPQVVELLHRATDSPDGTIQFRFGNHQYFLIDMDKNAEKETTNDPA